MGIHHPQFQEELYWGVRELGESDTAIAKMLGLSQPAVSIYVAPREKLVEEMGLELFED